MDTAPTPYLYDIRSATPKLEYERYFNHLRQQKEKHFPINTSYPFLFIANKYGLDYGEVLNLGHMYVYPHGFSSMGRTASAPIPHIHEREDFEDILGDIQQAGEYLLFCRIHGW